MTRAKPAPRRKAAAKPRHPNDWYVEPRWAVEAILPVVAPMLRKRLFKPDMLIWDPCCGSGTIPDVFRRAGFEAFGSDLVDRRGGSTSWHWLGTKDFLDEPFLPGLLRRTSIFSNPPYRHTEAFVRKAMNAVPDVVAVLVPINWLCSARRHDFFNEHPPHTIAFLSSRPSMPPGNMITALGDKAFKGGKTDFCWIIWNQRQPRARTTVAWIRRPQEQAA